MKPARQITDRAKRYRAGKNVPPGPKRCNFCGSRKNVDVDHITGDETDGDPGNLMRLCRSCNAKKGVTQARNRIGVRTRQFNPQGASNFTQYRNAVDVLLGISPGDASEATMLIRATSPAARNRFGEKLAKNPPTYQQYARAVSIHKRGSHDEGGTIIHATPPALRSRYAAQIARVKKQRRSEVPF
jgi:hypothetical protein